MAHSGGGYITTYTDENGDVTKVYAAMPVKITHDAQTSRRIKVNGSTVTEHSGGVSFKPLADVDPRTLAGTATSDAPISAYDALIALGANPADIESFKTLGADTSAPTSSPTPAPVDAVAPTNSTSGGGTQIGPPACVDESFDGSHGHFNGCVITKKAGTSGGVWYLTDASQSTGTMHDTGCFFCDELTGLKFGVDYDPGNIIQAWSPRRSYDVGSCTTNTVSLSFQGVGVSSTSEECPETFGLYGKGTTYYSTKWDGEGDGPSNGARATHSVDGVYSGAGANRYPGAYARWWYTTS